MNIRTIVSQILRGARVGMVSLAALQLSVGPGLVAAPTAVNNSGERTATPIKHVIVIIGENRSFDHVFATYVPQRGGPSGSNGHFTPSSAAYTTVKCGTTVVNGKTTTNFLLPFTDTATTEN